MACAVAQRAADVVRPHVGGEAVVAVVGHADRLGLVGPADGDQHGAEDLLARQPPVVGGVGEHGGQRVVALRQRAGLGRQAAEQQLGAGLLHALLDVAAHLLELLLVDDGADVGRLVERVAELELLGLVRELAQEIVEDVGMQEQARAGRARLALAREAHGGDDAVHHPVLVGVGVDDGGAFSAELQRHRHDAVGGRLHDELADLGRAREGELAHARMRGERGAGLLAVAGDDVEHALGQMLVADRPPARARRAGRPRPP